MIDTRFVMCDCGNFSNVLTASMRFTTFASIVASFLQLPFCPILRGPSLVWTVNPNRRRWLLMRRHRPSTWHRVRVTAHASGAYYAPFPARSRHVGRRDDGYCPGSGRLIDRTWFKCYRSLMLIWPVHLNAASKSRIIARNCLARRRIARLERSLQKAQHNRRAPTRV